MTTLWHDRTCRRLDLIESDDIKSCMSCGSCKSKSKIPAVVQTSAKLSSSPHAYLHGVQDDTSCQLTHSNGSLDLTADSSAKLIYQSLEREPVIRLLTLDPGELDDPICGKLTLEYLNHMPVYDALSYSWADASGNTSLAETVTVNGVRVAITSSCHWALKRIRKPLSKKSIWVDSICIDQDNKNERGHQVDLMPQIYARARKVMVYLGESDPASHTLIGFMRANVNRDQDVHIEAPAQELKRFLQRQYFSRVWVIQEVALAKELVAICGDTTFSWLVLTRTVQKLEDQLKALKFRIPPVVTSAKTGMKDPMSMLAVFDSGRGCKATDPRDKLFALSTLR